MQISQVDESEYFEQEGEIMIRSKGKKKEKKQKHATSLSSSGCGHKYDKIIFIIVAVWGRSRDNIFHTFNKWPDSLKSASATPTCDVL